MQDDTAQHVEMTIDELREFVPFWASSIDSMYSIVMLISSGFSVLSSRPSV